MTQKPWKTRLLQAAILFLAAWTFLVTSALVMENRLIFKPRPGWQDTPERHGLAGNAIAVATPDGETLRGWWFSAPGAARSRVIIWYHGNAGNASHRLHSAARLIAETGADVVLVDYRTYGQSSGVSINEKTLYTDALAIYDFVTRNGTSEEDIVLFGYSLGAAAALETALRRQPGRLVLGAAFTSIPAMAARSHWYVPFPRLLARTKLDNLAKIGQLKTPLLLFHGNTDPIVPAHQARTLSKAAPPGTTVHIFPSPGHRLRELETIPAYWDAWRRHLRSPPERTPA